MAFDPSLTASNGRTTTLPNDHEENDLMLEIDERNKTN